MTERCEQRAMGSEEDGHKERPASGHRLTHEPVESTNGEVVAGKVEHVACRQGIQQKSGRRNSGWETKWI